MAPTRIQFAAHAYQDRSLPVSAQRLVNLYLEQTPPGSRSGQVLRGTPGLRLLFTVGSGPIRGIIGMGDNLFVVSGQEAYFVDRSYTSTLLGTVDGLQSVAMAQNGSQVCIVADTYMYVATATTLDQTAETNAVGVAVQDGYGIFAERGTQRMYISGINDFTSFDALDYTLTNAVPDDNTAVVNANRETWVFGKDSIQVYYNSGNPDFPFTRIASGVIQVGCTAARTVCEHLGSVLWLGSDRRVYRSNGYTPTVISTHAIEWSISSYSDAESAVGFVYTQDGHTHYVLRFSDATWVYDLTTGLWHQRKSEGLNTWRASSHAWQWDMHIAGDCENGNVYAIDSSHYTDNGDEITRIAASPPLHADGLRAYMRRFSLEMETGIGINSGQGSDPQVMLRFSDDCGRSWSNERWRSAGSIGDFRRRVFWDRLGAFRQRTIEVTISDPVPVAILDAYVEMEVGAS